MAITRRQFVTRLSALAAAAGLGGAQIEKISEAFAHWGTADGLTKPKVIWVHGAECTGCSTSVLGLLEHANSTVATGVTLGAALTFVAKGDGAVNASLEGTNNALGGTVLDTTTAPDVPGHGHRTLDTVGLNVDGSGAVNIADVLIDFIDLQYHETVMGMGGDLATKFLANELNDDGTAFVLVVEGAVQDSTSGGYWKETGDVPWCSVGASDDGGFEHSFDELVATLAARTDCAQVIAIGQCATGGGYPSAVGPGLAAGATVDALSNMTNAKGTYQYLMDNVDADTAGKVINVPGCPANPWWFAFTVVLWMYEQAYKAVQDDPNAASGLVALDSQRRLTAVYGNQLHSKYCPRYPDYAARRFASKPGDTGCMKNIGCKGLYTMSSCGTHGWNGQQPANKAVTANLSAGEDVLTSSTDGSVRGGNCLTGGSPCMGCTEKGYPDRFTPFVIR